MVTITLVTITVDVVPLLVALDQEITLCNIHLFTRIHNIHYWSLHDTYVIYPSFLRESKIC